MASLVLLLSALPHAYIPRQSAREGVGELANLRNVRGWRVGRGSKQHGDRLSPVQAVFEWRTALEGSDDHLIRNRQGGRQQHGKRGVEP